MLIANFSFIKQRITEPGAANDTFAAAPAYNEA
jgi:hypothetical protein